MNYLDPAEEQLATHWMTFAAEAARKALCLKAKCGSVVVKDGRLIGIGYNSPPQNKLEYRKCLDPDRKHDSCVHAEWRAITDALRRNPDKVEGSTIYFTRVDGAGDILKSGNPYCTVCSRLALDVGISTFVLWHDKGVCEYNTEEFNNMSYRYHD